jgi:hypothetical protein
MPRADGKASDLRPYGVRGNPGGCRVVANRPAVDLADMEGDLVADSLAVLRAWPTTGARSPGSGGGSGIEPGP